MKRCTISKHSIDKKNAHLDIFFQTDSDFLETYEAKFEEFTDFLSGNKILCSKKNQHRNSYLDYEGDISNNRGSVEILWKGFYKEENGNFPNEIKIFLVNNELVEFA